MNTRKLIKYIIMGAIMVLMIDSLPPKGIGDDTSLFLNPIINPPPPAVAFLLDDSGSMNDLPCAVPDCNTSCGVKENGSNFFISSPISYIPSKQYPVFDPCVISQNDPGCGTFNPLPETNYTGAPGAFYPDHVYSEVHACTTTEGWQDDGTATNFCNSILTLPYQKIQCKDYITNYGYYYRSNGTVYYSGNLLNWYPPKYVVLRKVISDIISYNADVLLPQGKEVRIAIMDFADSYNGQVIVGMTPPCSQLSSTTPNDYKLQGKPYNHIYGTANGDYMHPPTNTPLGDSLIQLGAYYAQTNTTFSNAACNGDASCTTPNGGGTDPWCGDYNGNNWECEKMFDIIITDGNENYADSEIDSWPIANYQADEDSCTYSPNSAYQGGLCHIDEIAGWLHNNDIRNTKCSTSVDTYTVGFLGQNVNGVQLNSSPLKRAAALGGGLFATGSNFAQIEKALIEALNNIIQKNRTYGTPSLPQIVTEGLNGTTTTNIFKAFIASFIPKNQNFWVGHLREYTGSASATGTIGLYDKFGVPFSGNTTLAGQCSFSEYVPPPIWDAGADLSDTTLPVCTSNVDDIGIGAPPCYLAPNLRNVYTVTPGLLSGFTSTTTGNGDSTWTAGGDIALGPGQLFATSNSQLSPSDFGVTDTTTMDNIINYVLGPKQDGIHVLGDIYHSAPTLISADALAGDWLQLSDPQIITLDYQKYLNAVYNRPQIVIAGSDDGMIHAFYAGGYEGGATLNAGGNYVPDGNARFDYGTGQEVWAFIPEDLLPKLQYMYDPALVQASTTGQYWTTEGIYTTTSTTHVYYVDASPFVRDVYLPGVDNGLGLSGNAAYWHTIMIIGERLGGTYYICLDITNTLHPKFMWEFTTNDMAFTFGEVAPNPPPIGPVWLNYDPATDASVSPPELRWVVLLSGGWDPGLLSPVRGNAFYMVDIATGKLVWKYDGTDDPNMAYSTPATPIGITQGMLGTIHPWWMESFLPDLGGQLWQFSFLHLGDNPPGVWAGSLGSNNIVKTCISPTDTNCFSGQRIFAAQDPPPARSQAQQFYYQPSAIGDPCGDLWIGVAAGDRNNPLGCTPTNNLYEINSPMPYVTQTPLLTASSLTQLTSLGGINSGLCGAGAGWWITLSSFTGTAFGTKSLSIPYATGGVEYFSVFTPVQNACVAQSTVQFSCNTLGGTGTMIGMAIYQIPGTGYKTGQVVFTKQTKQGIPSPPIPVTSIVGTPGSSGSNPVQPTPFSIPSCGTGAGNMALSTQIYGATSEGAIFNVGSISGANVLMYPILQLCIPKSVESTFMSPQNTWSSHGGR